VKQVFFRCSIFILAASFLDAWLTLWWVRLGWATEQNPVLQDLVNRPLDFMLVKMGLTIVGVLVLCEHYKRTLAFIGMLLGCLAYAYVMALHAAGATWAWLHG